MKEEEPDETLIVCSDADKTYTIRGTIFTHKCCRCQRSVMLSPSGQAFLKMTPQAKMICTGCVLKEHPGKSSTVMPDKSAVVRDLMNIIPNLWKKRN